MGDAQTFRFGSFHLIPDHRELQFNGEPVGLGSRSFDLLLALVKRHGQLVGKDELMAEVWPGKVVEENNLQAQVSALRKILAKDVNVAQYLQTAPGRGYRFLIDVERVAADTISGVPATPVESNWPVCSLHDGPSIAVLPFENLSSDSKQDYFSDGIADEIINALCRLRWLSVTAQNSSFTYRGNSVDVRHAARELGVRYILKGSVRKVADSLRITTQLIDGSTGNHIWVDRHDGKLVDLFSLQDEIASKVASNIHPNLLQAEVVRSHNRAAENLGAWDMLMRARSLLWRLSIPDGKAAIAILERATECHPEYAPAYSMLAVALTMSSFLVWDNTEPQTTRAFRLATRARELDDTDPRAHVALGFVALITRRTEDAVEEFQRAIELNPNFAAAHGSLGAVLSLDGQSDRAIVHLEQAPRMSPHDPQNVIFITNLATAHYLAGRYTEAAGFARKAMQLRHGMTGGHRIYIVSLAQAGHIAEAGAALGKLKQIQPDLSTAWIERHVPYTPGPMRHFLEGMRKAGLTY